MAFENVPAPLLDGLRRYQQEHVLRWWDELTDSQRTNLLRELEQIDLEQVARLYEASRAKADNNWAALAERAEPPPAIRLDAAENPYPADEARRLGEAMLRAGQVGAVLVAGGQGTRLGFPHPKGLFSIGPVSGASLFRILFEKLLAVSRRYNSGVPLYLMTSSATHEETIAYLDEHRRFGLPADDLRIFQQGNMPAVDAATGRLLMASKDSLCRSPDGHGGMLAALARSGNLADMRRRGLRWLFYFQVDNPLVPMCDPEFLGYHALGGSELSTQAVAKQDPLERVGNLAIVDGKMRIIEYSDLPEHVARRRNADGSLVLWAGNTAVHVFDLEFLERVAGQSEALPFHIARKKVPHLDPETGRQVEPDLPNAVKFERFIFDLLPEARTSLVVEVDASRTFAPVKNAPGEKRDTPESVQTQMAALHREWLRAAGADVADDAVVEISPLFALDEEDVQAKVAPGTVIRGRKFLE